MDPNTLLDTLEREWDLSLEAADSALDDWFEDDLLDAGRIDAVIDTQRDQQSRYEAVVTHRRKSEAR